jgi:hypothetical protein
MTESVGTALDRCGRERARCSRPVALVQLIATVALALSTVVAATAVSIGIARAEAFAALPDAEVVPFAIALLIALLFSAMGGLTAVMADDRPRN